MVSPALEAPDPAAPLARQAAAGLRDRRPRPRRVGRRLLRQVRRGRRLPGSKNCLLYASTVTSGLGGLCSATLATEYCAGAPPGGGKPYMPDDTPLSLDAPDNVEYIVGDVSMDDVSGGCGDADAGQCAEASGGDPVNLFTGQFDYAVVDHTVADLIPLQMGRVYRSSLRNADGQAVLGAFGLGMQPHYDLYLRETEGGARLQLVLPSGVAIPRPRGGRPLAQRQEPRQPVRHRDRAERRPRAGADPARPPPLDLLADRPALVPERSGRPQRQPPHADPRADRPADRGAGPERAQAADRLLGQ